jgi:hypothetical protein
MRPVKTVVRDGRPLVLTKTVNGVRRVSCSCCEEEQEPDCCMYPANEFAVSYNQDDLPDSVAINWPNNFFGVLEKDAATYKNEIITLDIANFRWRLRNSENGQSKIVGRCLFTEPTIFDTFADTYTVTTNQSSGAVTRQSLCVWTGVDANECELRLRYETAIDPIVANSRFKWVLEWAEGGQALPCDERAGAFKDGFQNTPAGEYATGQYLTSITVSE